jgi:hypothetical protein
MREGFLTLVGFLLTITPALAQTTVPTTPAPTPGPTGAAGVADWWWVILLVLVVATSCGGEPNRKRRAQDGGASQGRFSPRTGFER